MKDQHRRIWSAAVALLCSASLAVTMLPGTAYAVRTAKTTDYLNLRTGAGATYPVILTMPTGTELTILDDSQEEWAQVKTASGQVGYCSKTYLADRGLTTNTHAAAGNTAVTTGNLNVRTGIGTSYGIVTTLAQGATVTILDNSHATWAKVRTASGQEGYCLKEYLQFSDGGTANSGTAQTGNTAVTKDYLNVRKGPGTTYDRLMTLAAGVTVTITDHSNAEWVKIRTSSGVEGYCSREYLEISAGASSGGASSGGTSSGTTTPPTGTGSEITATVTDNLNLREGAGPSYAIMRTMPKGTVLTVIDNSHATWAKVRLADGTVGCCVKEFLNIQTPTALPTQTTPPAASTPGDGKTYIGIVKESLALRKGAGTSYDVIRVLMPEEQLTITDNTHATWAKVKTADGTEGCCMKEFLEIREEGANETPPSGGDPQTITGATVTADALRMRSGPGTTYEIVTTLMKGTSLTVLDTSNAEWTKVQTGSQSGYVSTEYIQFQYNGNTNTNIPANGLTISRTTGTVSAGKTLYIKATPNPSTATVTWSSSNTAVATVSNGYIYAVSPGTAVITASSGSQSKTCTVTVTAAEAVKTAYTTPNLAGVGSTVTFVAVTDTSRDAVRFTVQGPNGAAQTVYASSSASESVEQTYTKVWKATMNLSDPGTYKITANAAQGGVYSATGFTTSAYVVSSQDFTVTTNEERRVSDQMLNLIANWEGYASTVYADKLSSTSVPTVGYGFTFKEGDTFYNNLTKTEAWSLLVNTVNNASYTTEVNKFIKNNNLRMNQNQFDSLVSFGYNVGAAYWNNSSSEIDLRRIILNAVVPPDFGSGISGTVSKATAVRSEPNNFAAQTCEVAKGTVLTALSANFANPKDGWYMVNLTDGTTGWINSAYVTLNSPNLVHDLNYTNAYAFGTDMLRWNQAGGKSYAGLLYRRLGEANVYNYNDYSASRVNSHGYTYPSALAYLDVQS